MPQCMSVFSTRSLERSCGVESHFLGEKGFRKERTNIRLAPTSSVGSKNNADLGQPLSDPEATLGNIVSPKVG